MSRAKVLLGCQPVRCSGMYRWAAAAACRQGSAQQTGSSSRAATLLLHASSGPNAHCAAGDTTALHSSAHLQQNVVSILQLDLSAGILGVHNLVARLCGEEGAMADEQTLSPGVSPKVGGVPYPCCADPLESRLPGAGLWKFDTVEQPWPHAGAPSQHAPLPPPPSHSYIHVASCVRTLTALALPAPTTSPWVGFF